MSAHMDDARYRIPGTNIQNFTAWSRENEPKEPPKFWLNHRVIYTPDEGEPIEGIVVDVFPDCDYTPLYAIRVDGASVIRGVSGSSLVATPSEPRDTEAAERPRGETE